METGGRDKYNFTVQLSCSNIGEKITTYKPFKGTDPTKIHPRIKFITKLKKGYHIIQKNNTQQKIRFI